MTPQGLTSENIVQIQNLLIKANDEQLDHIVTLVVQERAKRAYRQGTTRCRGCQHCNNGIQEE